MNREEVVASAEQYWRENYDLIMSHIEQLVQIPSTEDLVAAAQGAPYGPGPAAALDCALDLASGLGMEATNCEGHIGFADIKGETDTQIGIIGHVDVVPAGPGWTVEPYAVTVKDGYLLGRGVIDDKGPSVVGLHAMKCLAGLDTPRPYTMRFIFGANEESGMRDIEYYRARYEDPAFLFTPDADFPVCYGEKGGFDGVFTSKLIEEPTIIEFIGGTVTNAVPGVASVLVKADAASLPAADRLTITEEGEGLVRIDATGENAHAAWPERGISAINLLVEYMLANNVGNEEERAFLQLQHKLVSAYDGSGLGIKTEDEYFGPLTVVGGTVELKDGHIIQTLDSRFPTSITAEEMISILTAQAEEVGATFENTLLMPPFLVKPEDKEIQILQDAFQYVTGDTEHKPFTIGGGTYAREFTKGASFGPNMPWIETPEWVKGEHGPDEGVAIELLKTAFVIYVLALYELQQAQL